MRTAHPLAASGQKQTEPGKIACGEARAAGKRGKKIGAQ